MAERKQPHSFFSSQRRLQPPPPWATISSDDPSPLTSFSLRNSNCNGLRTHDRRQRHRAHRQGRAKGYTSLPPPSSNPYTKLTLTSPAAKAERANAARKRRTDERKAKRHAKSEAKQARKLNVQPSAKWTPERKAEMKLKKIANKPAKDAKRKNKLTSRIQKYKIQADKMIMMSKRAEQQLAQLIAQEVS